MRRIIIPVMLISFISLSVFFTSNSFQSESNGKYTLVIHGGAGTFGKSFPDSLKEEYFKSLREALQIGKSILEDGGGSLDAVEQVVRYLEDDEKFNAGKGAVYNSDGIHELDASIMDGKDLSSGAVTLVTNVKNPISLARLVMEKTPHIILGGKGAENFAKEMNVEVVPNQYFNTERRLQQLKNAQEKNQAKGTVGAVALDKKGNLAAATSTGGMTNKMPGRIGDSPLINAGTYANNKTCAVSGTGTGELFIKNTVAFNISALMEYKGMNLKEAANEVIYKILEPGDGGIIAVDKNGNFSMEFNTEGMLRGVATSDGIFEVAVFK